MLAEPPQFEPVVLSATGKMALMKTVDASAFVAFQRWRAASAQDRPPIQRGRDLRQADIVRMLLDEGLLVPEH